MCKLAACPTSCSNVFNSDFNDLSTLLDQHQMNPFFNIKRTAKESLEFTIFIPQISL